MKKIIYTLIIIGCLSGGYFLFVSDYLEEEYSNENDITDEDDADEFFREKIELEYIDGNDSDDEDWDTETEEDCTQYEKYDEEEGYCYFECDTDEECFEIEQKIEAELDTLSEDYENFSQNFKEFNQNNEELKTEPEITYKLLLGEKFKIETGVENDTHIKVKKWVANILPNQFSDDHIDRLVFYNDPTGDAAAYVDKNPEVDKWDIFINLDTLSDGEKEMIFTIIHEFTHILTLNSLQIDESILEESCQGYYIDEGCAKNSAYLNSFYEKFWHNKYKIEEEDYYSDKDYDSTADKNMSDFVSEYATLNPAEDIAESFAFFVLNKKPNDAETEANQKIIFFYSYPELIKIRESMRSMLTTFIHKRIRL